MKKSLRHFTTLATVMIRDPTFPLATHFIWKKKNSKPATLFHITPVALITRTAAQARLGQPTSILWKCAPLTEYSANSSKGVVAVVAVVAVVSKKTLRSPVDSAKSLPQLFA